MKVSRSFPAHATCAGAVLVLLTLGFTFSTARTILAADCEPCVHPVPPRPIGAPLLLDMDLPGGGDWGRIAVVVQSSIYDDVYDSIRAYGTALTDEGYTVSLLECSDTAEALRAKLQAKYANDGLVGAVLVGDIPYIIFQQYVGDDGPSDLFYMDLDGIWTMFEGKYVGRDDANGQAEIWVTRIKVDNLLNLKTRYGMGDADVINAYFARNLALRRDLFYPANRTLVYSRDYSLATCLTRALGQAFDLSITGYHDVAWGLGESWDDYLRRLGRTGTGGSPDPYYWITELNHGGTDSHGAGSGTALSPLSVMGTEGDHFGQVTAISGDTLLVGAPGVGGESACVYVLVRQGEWSQQATLTGGATGDWFAFSVAVDGDTAVVGAPGRSVWTGSKWVAGGAVFVFVRSGSTWTQTELTAGVEAVADEKFGASVSVAGDTILVGAPGGQYVPTAGSVYVFERTAAVWSKQTRLIPSDGEAWDEFGRSASVSGDTALVGAPRAGVGGAAYAFTRSEGVWTPQAKLVPSDIGGLDEFGLSLALSGDTALVGAPLHHDGAASAGAAYVYARSGGVWGLLQKLVPPAISPAAAEFGHAVALDDMAVLVGAPGTNDGSGAAYPYCRSGDTWSPPWQEEFRPQYETSIEHFGQAVAVQGATVVAGAPLANSGAGLVYHAKTERDVNSRDYLDMNTKAIGVSILSCDTCDYSTTMGPSSDTLGQAVASNPSLETNVLLVFGYTKSVEPSSMSQVWKVVAGGGSFGDGLRAEVSSPISAEGTLVSSGFTVVLGDGTLRAMPIKWTGHAETGRWNDRLNWDSAIPGRDDHVRIDAGEPGVTVEMDMPSTPMSPYEIWSLTLSNER